MIKKISDKLNWFLNKKHCFFVFFIMLVVLFAPFYPLKSESYDADISRRANELLVKYYNNDEIYLIEIDSWEDLDIILKKYNNDPKIEYAEPNYLYHATIIPSDSYFSNQWYLKKIKAPEAWNIIRESPDITIAIVDSGVQLDHPDLSNNIWRNAGEIPGNGIDDDKNGFIDDIHGWDFVNNVSDPEPKFKEGFTEEGILHGTIVAGVAAASGNNASGISGITWHTKIMPLKVLDDKGEGDTRNVVRAVDYAIANGADIINFSFVGFGFSRSLENAIKRAYDVGIIIAAAAGNEQGDLSAVPESGSGKRVNDTGRGYLLDETPMYPVCHDGSVNENMVIGVAATDTLDQKTSFSGYGFNCIDIAAPGVSIFSTTFYRPEQRVNNLYFNKYYDGYWSGTSMAVPMISGTAALIETVNPRLSRSEVVDIIVDNSDNINRLNPDYLGRLGKGRINVNKAIIAAKNALNSQSARIIVSPQTNKASDIKITNKSGEINLEFRAYNDNFRGGVNVAAGDVDGDGEEEIITGAGFGGGPHVRIFNADGSLVGQFFAYREDFRGGVNVAVGDVDGDGEEEIITGAGFGGGPQVRIFRLPGFAEGQFFAYDKKFRGGVRVATADIDGGARRHKDEIITAPGKTGGPHIKIFDNHAKVLSQFFAYNKKFKGGVSIAAIDINTDGFDEIVTGAGPGGTPHVRTFDKGGKIISSFFGFDEDFSDGVNVSAIRMKN